jgi:hypothetical protein
MMSLRVDPERVCATCGYPKSDHSGGAMLVCPINATWKEPPAAPSTANGGEAVACVGCEGKPAPENNPCAVCGLATPDASTALREAYDKCDPVLRDTPKVSVLANLLAMGAEHQIPKSKQFSRGELNAEADAEFIVAAINFARAALTKGAEHVS